MITVLRACEHAAMPSPARSVRTGTVEGSVDRPQGGSATMVLLRHLLGDALRRLRVRQGRTLREVSATARVSLGYLSEVERGRKEASSELLSAICDALDVPLSELLVEAGEQLARREHAVSAASAANIDVSTKVVIPPVVSMAVA